MAFVKLIPLVISLLSSGGKYAEIIKNAVNLIELVVGTIQSGPDPVPEPTLDVQWVQRRLAALGFDPGTIDGDMGPKTMAAIRLYQQSRGLVVDGWAGINTQAKLLSEPVAA